MALLRARGIELAYGSAPLLEGVDLEIEPGERVALVGRNGTGKSSLLRVLAGTERPDAGECRVAEGAVVGWLPQELPRALEGTVEEIVREGLEDAGEREDWEIERSVSEALDGLGLDGDQRFDALSGGLKRRTLLARALARAPRLLMLDEPTNHLDLPTIEWLEARLLASRSALLFVTHDRGFLARLATRIAELDRGRLRSYPGSYTRYLELRDAELAAEERANAQHDDLLAREEVWIRKGIQARRTRNQGRVRALERLRAERAARRERVGRARIEVGESERSGKLVVELDQVCFGYPDGPLVVDGLSTTILRGDRVGLLGPNGSGKTTLLELLLGKREPLEGRSRLGTNLEIAYYDQTRASLDEERSIIENVGDGKEFIELGGRRRHLIGYLGDFLFPPERCRTPVKALSGGERNRVLLARLFARPANLLVLDEPTNDLDLETLEILEERLVDFDGTLLVVSHDRVFLDRVVTSTLVMEGQGRVGEYAGGYEDWLRQRPDGPQGASDHPTSGASRPGRGAAPAPARVEAPRKLSYMEGRELDEFPRRIEALEDERSTLYARLGDPNLARSAPEKLSSTAARLATLESEIEAAYRRWQELEARPR